MAWEPDEYSRVIRTWIHDYDELQEEVVLATSGIQPKLILDLGIGAGETANRVLELHPQSRLVGVDSSPEMLHGARASLPAERVTLLDQDLAAPLPGQLFDLIISALAIHHLEGTNKATLFRDIARCLAPGGLFVMGDVIVPPDPQDSIIENEEGYDFPSTIDEQMSWLEDAGFAPVVVWVRQDLAVIRAQLSSL